MVSDVLLGIWASGMCAVQILVSDCPFYQCLMMIWCGLLSAGVVQGNGIELHLQDAV